MSGHRRDVIGAPPSDPRLPIPWFTVTTFLSAFLLFSVQPMIAKIVLPLLGGSPAVWNTCLMFFQGMVLAGYAYAHATTARLGLHRQIFLHLPLLCVAGLLLPISVRAVWTPSTSTSPIPWLLRVLLGTVGLPFLLVATSAPLLQHWFARIRHPAAADPYFLYSASNLGSLSALLSYPVLIEPHLRLASQSRWWAAGYGVFAALMFGCAALVWRWPSAAAADQIRGAPSLPNEPTRPAPSRQRPAPARRIRWLLLSFVPSSLLLGATTHISTDVAAVPLLWVVPLAIYLLTFILVFARTPPLPHAVMVRALPIVVLPLAVMIVAQQVRPMWLIMCLHLLVFFMAAMVCHGELALDRPPSHRLTEFYLWMSLGGVLGGLFNALIAPLVFKTVIEYPFAITLACLLRPRIHPSKTRRWGGLFDYLLPASLGAFVISIAAVIQVSDSPSCPLMVRLLFGLAALVCVTFLARPIRFGLGIGALLLAGTLVPVERKRVLHVERSFFGVYRVVRDDHYRYFLHGTTVHGLQSLEADRRRQPLAYYDATGPVGQLFDAFTGNIPRLRRIAVAGLGAGALACYASPGQEWIFYELDPAVQRIARDPRYFTYLRDCLERVTVVPGDARLTLAGAADYYYDLIVLDAFSSDAIPVHLLTREALQLYQAKLAHGGVIAFHISNRYLDLEPVLGDLAATMDLVCLSQYYEIGSKAPGESTSRWIVMARQPTDLGPLMTDPRWHRVRGRSVVKVWTDDFSNIIGAFKDMQ